LEIKTMSTTYDSQIGEIVQSIFSTMLNIDAARVEDDFPPSHDCLVTSIQITGEWVGSVVLGMSPTAACAAAAAMLRMPSHEVTDSDQQEVAAELVNMIGGNLKSLLPGPSCLSLPTVVTGHEFNLRMHGAKLTDDVLLGSDVGWIRVRMYTKDQL